MQNNVRGYKQTQTYNFCSLICHSFVADRIYDDLMWFCMKNIEFIILREINKL